MNATPFSSATSIAGIGYSRSLNMPGGFSKQSNESVMTLVVRAVRQACDDAGIDVRDLDGAITYQVNDSVMPHDVLCALGVKRVRFELNCLGGGYYSSQAVFLAGMAVHAGLTSNCVVFRGMNGRSGLRMGQVTNPFPGSSAETGGGYRVGGPAAFTLPYGMAGAHAIYALQARRWMDRYGVTSTDLGRLAVQSRQNATRNPRAMMRTELTLEDHQNSRLICDPYRLLDCCLETDSACAMIVTSSNRARDCKQPPVAILAGAGGPDRFRDETDTGFLYMGEELFGLAGITRNDVDVAMLYDNFSDCPMRMIEHIGWCGEGEVKDFIREGHTSLDGDVPVQTSGGMMNEGYCHGLNNALELVQQLRGQAEDGCPDWALGNHTFDRAICRQVRDARIGLHTGSVAKSAVLLGRM